MILEVVAVHLLVANLVGPARTLDGDVLYFLRETRQSAHSSVKILRVRCIGRAIRGSLEAAQELTVLFLRLKFKSIILR